MGMPFLLERDRATRSGAFTEHRFRLRHGEVATGGAVGRYLTIVRPTPRPKEHIGLVRFYVFLAVYALAGLYVGARLLAALTLGAAFHVVLGVAIFLLASAMPLALLHRRRLRESGVIACYVAGGYYMAWLMWGTLAAVGADAVRLFAWAVGLSFAPGFGRSAALGVLAIIAFLTLYGTFAAASTPRMRRVDLALPHLPEHLEGTTIAHLSDLHLGYLQRAGRLVGMVNLVNAEGPDLVVLTGDQADGDPDAFVAGAAPLSHLCAPLGVYAVNGNHEHYGGAGRVNAALGRAGITVLVNEWVEVAPALVVAGLGDPAGRRTGEGADLDKALAGIPSGATVVLLSHQPQIFDEACVRGVDLTLSGHTHGGQVWPWGFVAKRFHTYVAGHYRHGPSQLYVSCGVGTWGPLLRLGAPPEILLYRLTRAATGTGSRRWQNRLLWRRLEQALAEPGQRRRNLSEDVPC